MGPAFTEDATNQSSIRFAPHVAGSIGAPLEEASTWTVTAADEATEDATPPHCSANVNRSLDIEIACPRSVPSDNSICAVPIYDS